MLAASPVFAGPATDALSSCLADNTTGKDRKDLAKWIFVAMAAHPELKDISKVTPAGRDQVDQAAGAIFSRMLTQSCVDQTRHALQQDGRGSIKVAFGVLGQLAMAELMANPQVSSAITGFQRFVDNKKIEALLTEAEPSAKP